MAWRHLWLVAAACAAVSIPIACSAPPIRCAYVDTLVPQTCPVCVLPGAITDDGEDAPMPSFSRDPDPEVPRWSGAFLPEALPPARIYVRCRPCDCAANGRLEPYDAWRAVNERAYARLRGAHAPYPVVIVPGFHAPGVVTRYRVRRALDLLAHGWVASIMVSGGYRRAGWNEGARLYDDAIGMGARLGIDVRDKIFIEPCACHSSTNVRDTFRMLAAMRLPRALLLSETRLTGQANVFSLNFDRLVDEDLRCHVGRMSYLRGPVLNRVFGNENGCRAPLSLRLNPITLVVPRREAVLFWVSPFGRLPDGHVHSALECGEGSREIASCEPDTDPDVGACLPAVGRNDTRCTPPTVDTNASPPPDDEP